MDEIRKFEQYQSHSVGIINQTQLLSREGRSGRLTPSASARRMEEMPLSDCSISHKPANHTRSGSLVACRGVRVVTVNWKRQVPLEHWKGWEQDLFPPLPVAPTGDGASRSQTPQGDAQGGRFHAGAAGRGATPGLDWPATLSGLGDCMRAA